MRPRVGPYEIIGPLGAGGMGKVYRAWDPRLNREVALKVLPDDVASDMVRRRRFLDEARAAAGLTHPNVVAVYDVHVGEGTAYIVTELLQGTELRDEIDRGPLPTKRLLDLAVQTAEGLSAAHAAGIVHRDLKPENVIVTRDGRVKILDFGLAKVQAAASVPAAGQTTVTLPSAFAGTPHYMSPEQARGAAVDFRSDQFSFGLILYEMATGVQPFRRDTSVQSMAAILEDEVRPVVDLNRKTPSVLQWIIERCLAKNPDDRYASTADLVMDLATLQRRLAEVSGHVGLTAHTPEQIRLRISLGIVAGLAVLAAAAAAVAPPDSLTASAVNYRPFASDARFQGAPAWSPDGKTLAYVAMVEGVLQVYTKRVMSPSPHQLTEERFDCKDPFWSPDGTRIYYHSLVHASESLWSISAAGGPPEPVVENATQATISPDGRTLAFFREGVDDRTPPNGGQSIWLASPTGGELRRFTEAPFDTRTFVNGTLRFSPDGSRLLAWVWGRHTGSTVTSPEFWILPVPSGRPYRVLPALARTALAATSFDWLPDGRHIVVSLWDVATTGMHLWIADVESGAMTPLTSPPGSESRPAVAPGGRALAFTAEAVDFDLVQIPLDGAPARPFLATSRNELDPAFAGDGSQYAYVSDKHGVLEIWIRSRDGQFERLVVGGDQFPDDATLTFGAPALSPDRQRIAYQRYGERTGYQIWVSTLAAAGPPVQLVTGSIYQDAPTWSPDGGWIAFREYLSDATSVLARARVGVNERPEIILRNVRTLAARPRWSPDGRWILSDTDDGLVVVSPNGGTPRVLSEEMWIAFTWSTDSRRIYGLREADRPHHFALASVDLETLKERVINPDLGVIPPAHQPIRGLELVGPDTLATSIASARSDIWLAEGLTVRRRTLVERLPWRR